jgi:hypothetical protein
MQRKKISRAPWVRVYLTQIMVAQDLNPFYRDLRCYIL